MPIRTASAHWLGTLTEGSGTFRTIKGGYEGAYSYQSRFEEGEGANPEELVGAALAGCYSMFLSKVIAEAGHTPVSVETTAEVHLDRTEAGMTVTRIDLATVGTVPEISDAADFVKLAEVAKAGCPISRLLSSGTEITVTARLT